jgi:nitroreductase
MFDNLIQSNRSYRRFTESERLPASTLARLVGYARLSPSAANLQTFRFFLVWKEEDCARLFPHLKWAGYLRYWDGPEPGERPSAYVIMLSPAQASKFHQIDAGIAAQSILLGAVALGWGGCMLASVAREEVMKEFRLPDEYGIALVLALGKPAETVVVETVTDPDDIEYWRDDDGVHHVPKRPLEELILNYASLSV